MPLDRRTFIAGAATATLGLRRGRAAAQIAPETFVFTNSGADSLGFLTLPSGDYAEMVVGPAPWGIALAPNNRAFVTTASGIDVIDLAVREVLTRTSYESWAGGMSFGEYRQGGMGIAAAPDGSRAYAGVYLSGGPSIIEVLNIETGKVIATRECGVRPFQLLSSTDGSAVYTIDHDSYTVTVLDTKTLETRTLTASPLGDANGLAGFEKPHYAALTERGTLLMPFQGQALLELDPSTGDSTVTPLTANTHQHGIALSPGGGRVAIVGTGPAGGASEGPSLSIVNLESGAETIHPLDRPHEQAIWTSDGAGALLTGGYTFAGGGWNGLTLVNPETGETTEYPVGIQPLDIARLG